MEEHLIPPPNSDPEFRSKLTRTVISNSASSASVAIGTPAHAAPGIPTLWTNEKHRSYINSLETSFVNKLYQSSRLPDCHPHMYVQGTHPSQELPFKTYNSSDQFILVRDRCSQKIICPRNETPLESTADSNVTVERLRMDHIVSCHKGTHLIRKQTSEHLGVTERTSEQNPACRQDIIGSTAGISGTEPWMMKLAELSLYRELGIQNFHIFGFVWSEILLIPVAFLFHILHLYYVDACMYLRHFLLYICAEQLKLPSTLLANAYTLGGHSK